MPERQADVVWRNYIRPTNFIGGVIDTSDGFWPTNIPLYGEHRRHHLDYWIEPKVMRFLLDVM